MQPFSSFDIREEFKQQGASTLQIQQTTQQDLWFGEEEIINTLLRFNTNAFVKDNVASNEQLLKTLQGCSSEIEQGSTIVIPLNVNVITNTFLEYKNNHWVGLILKKEQNTITITYVDPIGEPMAEEMRKLLSETLVNSIINEPLQNIGVQYSVVKKKGTAQARQSKDSNSKDCGAFLVYLLIAISQGKELTLTSPLSREKSLQLGQTLRRAYNNSMNFEEIHEYASKIVNEGQKMLFGSHEELHQLEQYQADLITPSSTHLNTAAQAFFNKGLLEFEKWYDNNSITYLYNLESSNNTKFQK